MFPSISVPTLPEAFSTIVMIHSNRNAAIKNYELIEFHFLFILNVWLKEPLAGAF